VERGYVELKEKKFHPTELGRFVIHLLLKNFDKIFDVGLYFRNGKTFKALKDGYMEFQCPALSTILIYSVTLQVWLE